jgi:hypothetical protein
MKYAKSDRKVWLDGAGFDASKTVTDVNGEDDDDVNTEAFSFRNLRLGDLVTDEMMYDDSLLVDIDDDDDDDDDDDTIDSDSTSVDDNCL